MKLSLGGAELVAELIQASHLSTLERLPWLLAELGPKAGFHDVLIYLADLQQEALHLLAPPETTAPQPTELRIEGTLAGKAFQHVQTLAKLGAGGRPDWWWVPMLDGTERLGVIRVSATEITERTPDDLRCLASTLALLVVSMRGHSDRYAELVRTRPMSVTAEMQWNLMPAMSFANDQVVIAAALEPAYDISGDAFDYGLTGDTLHLEILDAMGHDASAGLTASLTIAACRSNRHQGKGLLPTVKAVEEALLEEFGSEPRFATAILADLDIPTGKLTWVNCGHHPPVVIRGGRWVTTLECQPSHPLGLELGLPLVACSEQLEPGDLVLLYTDGITEARNRYGQEFGLARFADFVIRSAMDGLPVQETLRRLIRSILKYHDQQLQDDATVLLVEWHGSSHRRLQM
ncbi:PP2C family protein-serine/threonine phosphatase [Sphaerisporangium perillae]|uniref:PP2C family protein-serine/threonine phosphatase n=1 Tax=Sphaerisporangium perillae TaxID=2935860 RepID=UPI00200C5F37|nr:PP2C family protein-serine/threonine phosphatase [Sphaerisporangium perillae]